MILLVLGAVTLALADDANVMLQSHHSVMHMMPTHDEEMNMTNASALCLGSDSDAMWAKDLVRRPYQDVVKKSFYELTARIADTVKSNPHGPCPTATIVASLFPKMVLQGRQHTDDEVSKIPQFTGTEGCGIYVVSDWQAEVLANVAEKAGNTSNGWHLIPFATDTFLQKIVSQHRSNELQRLYNLLKVAAPLYLPEDVKQVTFGDVKCPEAAFSERVAQKRHEDPTMKIDIHTFRNEKFGQKWRYEFRASLRRVAQRQEDDTVRQDIFRLSGYLGRTWRKKFLPLPDIMCMSWYRSPVVATVARRWIWYIATFSMRAQLSFDAALFDCGPGVKVDYMDFIPPDIEIT
eukprot:Skav219573  [mRNA]  locus=scaffold249:58583:59626:+ [translate_table: standard]